MSIKIPFKISARTARLIGRQNFPNAEGAIIELVKNSYDADASICVVFFDTKLSSIPKQLSKKEYSRFLKKNRQISKYYNLDSPSESYIFIESTFDPNNPNEEIDSDLKSLKEFFKSECRLLIIDNGEGMTDKIIDNQWMTIGTNNKEVDFYTNSGRVKTGEKGIGRFALDKLGDQAEMLTKPNTEVHKRIKGKDITFLWQIDWRSFEGDAKTLNEVEAELVDFEDLNFIEQIKNNLSDFVPETFGFDINSFETGTQIEIKKLRDDWNNASIKKLFTNLEVLIPPREERGFDVFLFDNENPTEYGKVSPSICDDYDYKVKANIQKNGSVKITINRNEFDVSKLPDKLFKREMMQQSPFTRKDFEKGEVVLERDIGKLVPGLKEIDDENVLKNIGAFEFIFYFMKQSTSNIDKETFVYKDFNSSLRKKWFNQFGGIRLFRDNFRVRPYGEVNNAAFDWLLLGERASRSPSSIGQQRQGTWRVRPNQLSGIINISRLTNIKFEDTSSRYGLQENKTFSYFTQVILGILDVFENDRTKIGRELKAFYEATHENQVNEEEAKEVKERVKKSKAKREKTQAEKDSATLLKYAESLEGKIVEMKDETNLLRILAGNGLLTASFTHELRNIKDNLVLRVDELSNNLKQVVDSKKCNELPHYLNPFNNLDIIKNEDQKLKEWLHYSLESLRRDKRRRKNIQLFDYFESYKKSWRLALKTRGVTLNIELPQIADIKLRAFEADIDCIFNNLLINSFEAFLRKDAPSERTISIKMELSDKDLIFHYIDSGPGISRDILDHDRIFEPNFTTKKDLITGEDVGTGLGMWLVKSIVAENNGTIELKEGMSGFGVTIKLLDKVKTI